MYKNYFILNRFIIEAGKILEGFKLISAFSQDKNKLILEFSKGENNYYIEISTNPGFPFITLKNKFKRAKKNTIDFFESACSQIISSFEIADFDRIVKLDLKSGAIYFAIRGKFTNIHFIDSEYKISSFKSTSDEIEKSFLEEVRKTHFINNFNTLPSLSNSNINDPELLRKEFPVLGKEIIIEAKLKVQNNSLIFAHTITSILTEIKNDSPVVYQSDNSKEIYLGFDKFISFPFSKKNKFDSIIAALNFYISKSYFYSDFSKKFRIIEKQVERDLDKTANKLNKLKSNLERESKEEYYNKIGNLLLININKIKKGMNRLEIEDEYSGKELIEVKLDENLSPKQNVDRYFKKARSEKIGKEKKCLLFEETKNEYEKFNKIRSRFIKSSSIEDLDELIKELKIKMNNSKPEKEDIRTKFKHYLLEDKFDVYVGKDSKNNDLLTTKFAKQNDYWFHARGLPGSHVVLRIDNTKEAVPKNILKAAASIAAFHSKAKTAGVVPVSYTFKKYVVKKKGMEPGKVALLKEEVFLVKPEIPSNCIYISNE
ncbi:MAG TPA: NFACT RNA binding domain-containing protein [Ignavibacteriaceae bacterium]|nr:NFACT RNA binding domain-containing protein [Ignavibacteriaceae bacterium]